MLSMVTMSAGAFSSPGHSSSEQRTSNSASPAVERMKSLRPCMGMWSLESLSGSTTASMGMKPFSATKESTALSVVWGSPSESRITRSNS